MKAVMIVLMLVAGMPYPVERTYDYADLSACRIALANMRMTERSDATAVAFCKDK